MPVFLFPLKLLVVGLLQRFFKKSVNTSEDSIHDLEVIQLNVFRESNSQINFHFIDEALNALHY